MTFNDELHIAVSLNHNEEVRQILLHNFNVIHELDQNGDQPAHIAARLGYIEIMKTLIEFDAAMGRRNYNSLNPIGEANMHGHMEIVQLIKNHYLLNKDRCDHNEPAGPEKNIERRLDPGLLPSQQVLREELRQRREEEIRLETIERWKRLKETECAILLQRNMRKKRAQGIRNRILLEIKSSSRIQMAWRWRHRDEMYRKKQRSARKIQSFQRMKAEWSFFHTYRRERLWWYRATRIVALFGQRLWRGHVGRSKTRRKREIETLPDPKDPANYAEWIQNQEIAHPPSRTLGVYAEYILSGTPRTWSERLTKRNGLYYRDVKFWVNSMTRRASWVQPEKWMIHDQKSYEQRQQVLHLGYTLEAHTAAGKMQSLWRANRAMKNLAMILSAKRIMDSSKIKFLTDPCDVVALCNYTLYVHAMLQNYEKARPLYNTCIERMEARGIDNPFILYGYAIFLAATEEDDFGSIKEYAYRANVAETRQRKRQSSSPISIPPVYELADVGFFRHAAIVQQSGEAWHNYALCRMLVFHDMYGARVNFIRAVKASPRNETIVSNFNRLLQDPDYLGQDREADWNASDELRLEQMH